MLDTDISVLGCSGRIIPVVDKKYAYHDKYKKKNRNDLRIDRFVKLETRILEVTSGLSLCLASQRYELGDQNLLLVCRWWRHLG
jgi:hypothetical protein